MKKLISLVLALALCLALAAAAAETKVEATELEAYTLELNLKTNTLVLTDRETRSKRVTDLELNALSDDYGYIDPKDGYFVVLQDDDLKRGLLDGQGKLVIPLEYADFEILSDRWIAAIRLAEATSDNYDYKSFGGNKFYLVDAVDLYYNGEKKGTLARAEWKTAEAFGDYLLVRDPDGNRAFYNKDFEKSAAETDLSREYGEDSSGKTVLHLGSNQPAFTAGCPLTPEEVKQSVWVTRDMKLLDLQGNELADFADYESAIVDADSGLIKLRKSNKKFGLADAAGKEIIPCRYDSLTYDLAGAKLSGYAYAEKDGKNGFVNLETGAETGFTFTTDAGKQRAVFIHVDDPREGKILISAAAGELPGRYRETNSFFPGKGDACPYAVVQEQDDTCHVIGQLGEDILPGVTFSSVYDPNLSEDGTLILLKTDTGKYSLYQVAYDPDLSAVPAPAPAAVAEEEETWTCENGHTGLTGNFCNVCGAKKPE